MIRIVATAATAFLMMTAATAASATTAIDYNVLTRNGFTGSNSDIEGALASGGNVVLSGYGTGSKDSTNATASGYSIVSAGTVSLANTQISGGKIMASAISASGSSYTAGAIYSASASPINIASEFTRLSNLSADMAANPASYGTAGTVSTQYGILTATGSSSDINVFSITGDQLASINTFNLTLPSGGIALFNVSGTAITYGNFGNNNYDPSRVLFNFSQASSIQANGGIDGSVLATNAAFSAGYYHVNGQTIASSITGNDQFNAVALVASSSGSRANLLALSAKSASPTPETSTWAMMIVGFGMVGGSLRRRHVRQAEQHAA